MAWSWLKFWSRGKPKKEDEPDGLRRTESMREDTSGMSEAERERQKLRHTYSISRSGRFKQKKRERGGILNQPELYQTGDANAKGAEGHSHTSGHSRTPSNTCREVHGMGYRGQAAPQPTAV